MDDPSDEISPIEPFRQRSASDRFKTIAHLVGRVSWVYKQNRQFERLPDIHLDNYLIVWGLRCRKFGTKRQSSWRLFYQRMALLYQVFITLKWMAVSVVSWWVKDEHVLMVLGDFTAYLSGTREYYHFLITFITLYPTVVMANCYYWRNNEKHFAWLKPFEVMKRTLKPYEVDVTEGMAVAMWKRLRYNLWNFELIRFPVGTIAVTVVAYCLYDEMDKQTFLRYGWFWVVLQVPWVWFTVTNIIGLISTFASVCHYFVIRFKKLELDADVLIDHHVHLTPANVNSLMAEFLKEFDRVCQQLKQFNYFWQLYILLHYVVFLPIVFVGLFEKFIAFENISTFHMSIISFLTLLAFFGWTYVALAAASITKHASTPPLVVKVSNLNCSNFFQAKKLYVPLNKLATISDMPSTLKAQLEIFIRRLGGQEIGFNCYRMFTPTHENYFNIIMFLASYFLLILDAPDIRKKYHV
ncbi:hypothetical protein HDE_11283 [Halotydeus destructor]|nr:hypothetical protein HDE_11283 [Halotydeus destructor]